MAEFAATLAGRRTDALHTIKRLVRDGLAGDLETGLRAETAAVVDHISGEAGATSVSAFSGRKTSNKEKA